MKRNLRLLYKAFPCSIILIMIASFVAQSCMKISSDTTITDTTLQNDTTIIASYTHIVADTTDFSSAVILGRLDPDTLREASGLAPSHSYPGFFWTINDSGNPNDVFLIDSTGRIRAMITLSNSRNRDWEDIAIGPGPISGITYLYVADIGDNSDGNYSSTVYRFEEPAVVIGPTIFRASVTAETAISFRYPDGPHNAETLMIDPQTKDLYVASKGSISNIYKAAYPQPDTLFVMKKIAQLPLSTLTAGDISSDGSMVLMKNYTTIYFWKRANGETLLATLLRAPQTVPYISEAQGEAVCWSLNGESYYTTSEVVGNTIANLSVYSRK